MRLWSRLKRTLSGDPGSDEVDEELEFHLEMDVAAGRARSDARRRLGSPERIADETRAVRVIPWLDSVLRDVAHSIRQMRGAPALSLAVVLSLALGIGMNAGTFNLIDAAVLKPLPVEDPAALVNVEWIGDGAVLDAVEGFSGVRLRTLADGTISGSQVSVRFHRRLAAEQTGFAALIGTSSPGVVTTSLDALPPESSRIQYVSSNFFGDLGVVPPLGRGLVAEDDDAGRTPVVVVSHRYWTSRLGQSPDALGRDVRIGDGLARIVGVAPPGFFGLTPGYWTDFYAPLEARAVFESGASGRDPLDDRYWWVHQIARLRDAVPADVAVDRLRRSFDALMAEIAPALPADSMPRLATSAAGRGFDVVRDREATTLWITQLLVAVLILIVSANVANLLLSKAVGQQHEYALRRALGASRARLVQRSFVESGLLAALGGLLGLGVGHLLARGVHALQLGPDPTRAFDLAVDMRLAGYVGALTLATTLLFGLAPAMRAARADLSDALKARSRGIACSGLRLPRALVAIQFALCLVAVIAAGLLGRTLTNLSRVEIAIEPAGLSYVTVDPVAAGYTPDRVGTYLTLARDALRALPEVDGASVLQHAPLGGHANIAPAAVPGRPSRSSGPFDMTDAVFMQGIDETTLATLGIALMAGTSDLYRAIGPDAVPVVVDARFVRHFLDGGSALGRRIRVGDNDAFEIVGVAEAARWGALRGDDRPVVYLPFAPEFWNAPIELAVRSEPGVRGLGASVRAALAEVDPAVPILGVRTQQALMDELLRTERLLAIVSAGFGLWAVALAAVGLGGMLFYAVARRTHEIGVRIALGAARADVVSMVLRETAGIVGAGVALGLPCAYAVGRLLGSTLFGLSALDPLTTAGALSVLLAVALAAAWLPAQRAARVDPVDALREE